MPKSITGAVGRGGRNFPASDVMTIQYLLNCVPATQGGPSPELAVDGAAGPKTIAAIEKFQRARGGTCDGRVDPGGTTLRALQARDPYPNQSLGPAAATFAPPFGKGSGAQAGWKDPHAKDAYGKGAGAHGGWKDPYGKDAYGKGAGAQGGWKDSYGKDAYGKGAGAQGGWKDPYGKDTYGKGAGAQGGWKDPYGKDAFGKGTGSQAGSKDPFGKDPFGKGGAGQGTAGQGTAKDPFGKGY